MEHLKNYDELNESYFVSKEEVDSILDKISDSGIKSLDDIERRRLEMFSTEDKEVVSVIEKMADSMERMREVSNKIKGFLDKGNEPRAKSVWKVSWLPINHELGRLEQELASWGIDLADPRLKKMLEDVRPSLFFSQGGEEGGEGY